MKCRYWYGVSNVKAGLRRSTGATENLNGSEAKAALLLRRFPQSISRKRMPSSSSSTRATWPSALKEWPVRARRIRSGKSRADSKRSGGTSLPSRQRTPRPAGSAAGEIQAGHQTTHGVGMAVPFYHWRPHCPRRSARERPCARRPAKPGMESVRSRAIVKPDTFVTNAKLV